MSFPVGIAFLFYKSHFLLFITVVFLHQSFLMVRIYVESPIPCLISSPCFLILVAFLFALPSFFPSFISFLFSFHHFISYSFPPTSSALDIFLVLVSSRCLSSSPYSSSHLSPSYLLSSFILIIFLAFLLISS